MVDELGQNPIRKGFSEPPAEVFAGLADRIRVPIWIFNKDLIVVYANEHTAVFGSGEDLGRSLSDFSKDVEETIAPLIADCLKTGSAVGYEGWVTSSLRGRCYWKVNVVALPGDLAGVVVNDFTGRKSAEHELDTSNRRYEQLFESIAEGVCTMTPEGMFEIVNPALERIVGVDPGTLSGRNRAEFLQSQSVPQEVIDKTLTELRDAVAFEVQIKRPDGELRDLYISAQPQYDSHGVYNGVLALIQDFTLYKQSQRRLKGSESLNQAFFHAIPDIIFLLDRSGKFLDFHARRQEDLAASPDEIIGRTVFDILPEGLARMTVEKVTEAFEIGDFITYEYQLTLKGQRRQFESRMCPSGDDLVLAVIRDVTDRYVTEGELNASLARFENLVDSLHDGVAIVDQEHSILKINDSLCRMLGYRREELVGSSLLDYLDQPNEYIWAEEAASQRVAEDSPAERIELTLLARDSRTVVAAVSSAPIEDTRHSFAVFTDITVQKVVEQELQVSEDEFRMVVNASKDAIVTIDERGLVRLFNPAAERLFNRRFGSMYGQPLDCLMPENLRERHGEFVRSYFATGKPDAAIDMTLELPAVTSDGTEFPIELSLSSGSHDQGRFVMAIIRDISQRQLMEEALRDSELRYRYIFENVGEGIVFLSATEDGDLVCSMVNAAAERLAGVEPGMLNGVSYRKIFDPDELKKVEGELTRRKSGEPGKYKVTLRRMDGKPQDVVITARPRFDENDNFIGSFCLVWDASEEAR